MLFKTAVLATLFGFFCFQVLSVNILQSAETYNAFATYTRFAWATYANQYEIVKWNCTFCNDTVADTINTVVIRSSDGQNQAYLAISPSLNSIIAAFRGSDNLENWIEDFMIVEQKLPGVSDDKIFIHSGFWSVWESLKPDFESALRLLEPQFPGHQVKFIGHSLGGAVATLAAVDLANRKVIIPSQTKIFTAGAPRIGNSAFVSFVESLHFDQIIRAVNYNDIVPHLITESVFYRHMCTEYWIDGKGQLRTCDDILNDGEGMNIGEIYLENLSATQWFELCVAVIRAKLETAGSALLVADATFPGTKAALGLLSLLLFRRVRLAAARTLVWLAKLLGGSDAVADGARPKGNGSKPAPFPSRALPAIHSKRRIVAPVRREIDALKKAKTEYEPVSIPTTLSMEDIDGGDDIFLDAVESLSRSRELLSTSDTLNLKLDSLSSQKNLDQASSTVTGEFMLSAREDSSVLDVVGRIAKENGNLEALDSDKFLFDMNLTSAYETRHKYSNLLDKSIKDLVKLEYSLKLNDSGKPGLSGDTWTKEWEKNGITMHTLPVDGFSIPIVRGSGIIAGGFTIPEVFSVVRSSGCRKKWDPRFESGIPLHVINPDDILVYTVQKGTFPVAARDFVVVLTTRRPSRKELIHTTTSVDAETGDFPGVVVPKPGDGGRVRGQLDLAAWTLKDVGGGNIETVYLVKVDPKGTLPSSLVKLVQNQTPLAISNINNYLTTTGPIPFIIYAPTSTLNPTTNTISFTSETWAFQTKTWTVTMSVCVPVRGGDEVQRAVGLNIAIPRAAYESVGAIVSAQATRTGRIVDSVIINPLLVIGPGVSATDEEEKRTGLLQEIVGSATWAVLGISVDCGNIAFDDGASNAQFMFKLSVSAGDGDGVIRVNGASV